MDYITDAFLIRTKLRKWSETQDQRLGFGRNCSQNKASLEVKLGSPPIAQRPCVKEDLLTVPSVAQQKI
jgi:hypothetical protein